MSLLRACSKRLPPAGFRPTGISVALNHTHHTTEFDAALVNKKPETEVAPVPTKDVITADVVSGAPSAFYYPSNRLASSPNFEWYPITVNSPASAPCRSHLPAVAKHHAVRWCQRQQMAPRLGHSSWQCPLGEPAYGLGELVRSYSAITKALPRRS
jgi:hypothetical protein